MSSTDIEGLNLKLRKGTQRVRKIRTAEKKAEMLKAVVEEVDGIYEIDHMCEESTLRREEPNPEFSTCIERIVERENMQKAYQRVMRNKGAPGIDKMQVSNLKPYLDKHWARIKQELLIGEYQPQSVRVVYIPKANGGRRQLGIPTVGNSKSIPGNTLKTSCKESTPTPCQRSMTSFPIAGKNFVSNSSIQL